MVGIVSDSATALAPAAARAAGITVVPLLIEVGGRSVEANELEPDEVTRLLRSGPVRTAAPSPGAFAEAIERADDGDGVLVLTVARRYSSSAEAARLAALQHDGDVEVVDTNTAAGGQALVVLAASEGVRSGLALDALAKQAQLVSREVRLVAEVGDLSHLAQSGRLPRRLASIGNAVGLRPVFELRRGSIRLLRPGLSPESSLNLMVETWRRSIQADHRLHVVAMHGGDPERAEQMLGAVAADVEPATSLVTRFGPAMVAHTGPDIHGLAWWWEPVPDGDGGGGRT